MLQTKPDSWQKKGVSTGLLFLPRIRGFSQLVTETEISHAQHIISELLEIIIHSNKIDLQISEIEDNAILYFIVGNLPDSRQISNQIKRMYMNFHRQVRQIEADSICECGACSRVNTLYLRFILHCGQFNISRIGDHSKLLGSDIILVHRLMQNSVALDEYILFTDSLYSEYADLGDSNLFPESVSKSEDNYEHIGDVHYHFLPISAWQKEIAVIPEKEQPREFAETIPVNQFIKAPMEDIFDKITDIQRRSEWMKGVKGIEYQGEAILRLGAKHVCDLSMGKMMLQSTHFQKRPREKVYTEKILHSKLFKNADLVFNLKEVEAGTEVELSLNFDPPGFNISLAMPVLRKMIKAMFRNSLNNLKHQCEIKRP